MNRTPCVSGCALMGYKDPEKRRQYQLQWMARRRQDWIDEHGPCAQCGSTELLEVDHIDRSTKAIEPRGIWSLSASKREAELAKCQVLCRPCHWDKTAQELFAVPPHGTKARYSRKDEYRCRCQPCRDARKAYERERLARMSADELEAFRDGQKAYAAVARQRKRAAPT